MAKYYMTRQIYRHKVRTITDQMLMRALTLGIEVDNIDELRNLYAYDGSSKYIENFLKWDDTRLMGTFTNEKYEGTLVHTLLSNLSKRHLFKRVFSVSNWGRTQEKTPRMQKSAVPFPDAKNRDALGKIANRDNQKKKAELEQKISEVIRQEINQDVRGEFVIVHTYSLKSVREQSRNNEGSILVYPRGSERPGKFEEISTVFDSINEQLDEIYLDIYAPVTYETGHQKQELLGSLREPLLALLREVR